ncbi:MAG: hypothetical protein AAGC60_05305 [Acidobacteriota bacterium]
MLEGDLPEGLDSFQLTRNGQVIATLPAHGSMAANEITALYDGPHNERRRLEAISLLNEETPAAPIAAEDLGEAILDRVLSNPARAWLASRLDVNLALARYRGFRDAVAMAGSYEYELLGLFAGGEIRPFGWLSVEVDGVADGIAAAEGFSQVSLGRCDAPEGEKDHATVALDWDHPGANSTETYAWSLRIAGYDLFRSVDELVGVPAPVDLTALAAAAGHDADGRVQIPGLEQVNSQPIVISGSADTVDMYSGLDPAFAQFMETQPELAAHGLEPGDRRAYYLVPRDQSGNWGETTAIAVSIPDREAPPAAWSVRAFPDQVNGQVRILWPDMTVGAYYERNQHRRTYCNLGTSRTDRRLEYVGEDELCEDRQPLGIDLAIAEYRVYRFEDSGRSATFVDRDGDGFHDGEERSRFDEVGSACDPSLPDPGLSTLENNLVAALSPEEATVRQSGRRVMEYSDPTPAGDLGSNYWYRIAAVDESGNVGPLSIPVRGFLPDRSAPVRHDLIGSIELHRRVCRYEARPTPPPADGRTIAVDTSSDAVARLLRLSCASAPETVVPKLFLPFEEGQAGRRVASLTESQCDSLLDPGTGCGAGGLLVEYLGRYGQVLDTAPYPNGLQECPAVGSVLEESCEESTTEIVDHGDVIPEDEGPFLDPSGSPLCVRVYRDLGGRKLRWRTVCPGDGPVALDFPDAGGDPICLALAWMNENAQLSAQYNLPCFSRPARPSPPSPITIEFQPGESEATLRFAQANRPADGALLEWRRKGDPASRQVRYTARDGQAALGTAEQLSIDVGPEPEGEEWREEWCFRGFSVGGMLPGDAGSGYSDWSEEVCSDRLPVAAAVVEALPWPAIESPPIGPPLQAAFAQSDDIGLVLLSERLQDVPGACLPEPALPTCDPSALPQGMPPLGCVGEPGDPPLPVQSRCSLCSSLNEAAAVTRPMIAYRQWRSGDAGPASDFHQISPLLNGPWCEAVGGTQTASTFLDDPWYRVINVDPMHDWAGYRLVFTDRFPYRDDQQLRYKFVFLDGRGEISGFRISNWIAP